jgi:hypothetical protein
MSEFSIIRAVRDGYAFVGREWKYLLRIALLPTGISMVTQLYLFFRDREKDISIFEGFIWGLPATALLAWFMFQESRLLLLGEKADTLPENPDYIAERKRAQNASILIWLLFSMGWSAVQGYQDMLLRPLADPAAQPEFWMAGLGALIFGVFFWGLRFGVAHILAAVNYPIRQYVRQVNGLGISLRLAGMALLGCIPVLIVFALLLQIVAPNLQHPDDPAVAIVVMLAAPVSILVAAVLNAAAGFALKEMLNAPGGKSA